MNPLAALQDFLVRRRDDTPSVRGLVVALSGGPDSLTLLLAAAQAGPACGYAVRALHVHHGLQAEADVWATQALAQAAAVGVPCSVLRVSVPAVASIEGAARAARYQALAAAMAPDEALLLAHHQDDQAETLLLRLMRGAGLHGLTGMQAVSRWRLPDGRDVARWRPWLELPRAALARWLPKAVACRRSHDASLPVSALTPVLDPANHDARFDRTLLRHEVLPLLQKRWSEAAALLARSAAQLAGQASALDALADEVLMRAGLSEAPGATALSVPLSLPVLAALDDAALQAVLARWLQRRGAPPLPVRYWPRVRRELLQARADAAPQLAWPGWSLRRYREQLYLLAEAELQPLPAEGADWPDPRKPLQWAGRVWTLDGRTDNDSLPALPWRLAPRVGGERWRPAGRKHSVSVKHWCQQQGIPPWQRERLVCVWAGDEVLAVVAGSVQMAAAGLQVGCHGVAF